jgi:hypothetical protein
MIGKRYDFKHVVIFQAGSGLGLGLLGMSVRSYLTIYNIGLLFNTLT